MDDTIPQGHDLWLDHVGTQTVETLTPPNLRLQGDFPSSSEIADRLYVAESLETSASSSRPETSEPYGLQWFLEIENRRHGRRGRWIPKLLEFTKHQGETLLGVGNGLGTDWVPYAREGAQVIVCSPRADRLSLVRRNFELRGLPGRFFCAPPFRLPLETSSVDVACLSGLFEDISDPQPVVEEVFRVLKPGGKVLAVVAARYDVAFWSQWLLPWNAWLGRRELPVAEETYSVRGLKRLFGRFIETRVHKRQLRRAEVPSLWRWLPLPILERLMGRRLILKGFKPLSAAMATPLAA